MPGRVFLLDEVAQVAEALNVPSGDLPTHGPRRNIAPGDEVLALGPHGLRLYRWGLIPVGRTNARGRPVMETIVNARSETLFDKSAFDGVGRAVLPVNGWYEWTGKARRKTPWEITPAQGGLLFFAAITDIWRAPGGTELHQLATVTCPPNDDVAAIHHRMAVILNASDVPVWLGASPEKAADLMRPWPAGQLQIVQADGDWFQ